jgi:hypothetical protein
VSLPGHSKVLRRRAVDSSTQFGAVPAGVCQHWNMVDDVLVWKTAHASSVPGSAEGRGPAF